MTRRDDQRQGQVAVRAGQRPTGPGRILPAQLPPLRAVLADLDGLGLLVVDSDTNLDPAAGPAWARMRTPSPASR